MPTAILQLRSRIKSKPLRHTVCLLMAVFTAFMVAARLISGVHWFTDIVGGAILSTGLVLTYNWLIGLKQK
jgi:undecaprenyl-diphosphatase